MAHADSLFDKVFAHLQIAFEYFPVVPVGKSLQIYIHGVNKTFEFLQYPVRCGTVGDHYTFQTVLVQQYRGITYEFIVYERFIVGKGYTDVTPWYEGSGESSKLFRGHDSTSS